MAEVFKKMASLSGFSGEDFEEFFFHASHLRPGEIGAVLGYLLGRLDSHDAAAMVTVLRERYPQRTIRLADGRPTVNIVGTGGGPSTFNITTTAAFVIAADGVAVVKTGSAACRSKSGFADVAAKLGTLKVTMPWERIEAIVEEVGIVFVPPSCHAPVMGQVEFQLTPTVHRNVSSYFNKLGPLLSPVKTDYRFIGANSRSCCEMLAGACAILGDLPATFISAEDGMDEVSSLAKTSLIHLCADGSREDELIDPASLGVHARALGDLQGYEPAAAAECCERILGGQGTQPQNEIVALNAGLVLSRLGRYGDLSAGYDAALNILASGQGLEKLRELREQVWQCVKR